MLFLTMKPNERIIINDEISIIYASRNGNQISVGFSAPDDVSIHREKIWLKIQEEKRLQGESNANRK